MLPKISIITPSFNQGNFLEETIESVLSQGHPNLEYIIIDGGSTDESVRIIRKFERYIAYWISEKDRGQPHALNKGLSKATGDIVAYINSDDKYTPGAFSAVMEHLNSHSDCEWLCGDTLFFGEGIDEPPVKTIVPDSAAQCLSWAYRAPQPGMFWNRRLLDIKFDERWRYCFDHELYVRLLLAGHKCEHLPTTVAAYRLHPASKTVAEGGLFADEFDEIADIYEGQLRGAGRRWTRGTRYLRQSFAASEEGFTRKSAHYLFKALLEYPEGIRNRPFWGCLRRLLLAGKDAHT